LRLGYLDFIVQTEALDAGRRPLAS